MISLKINNQTIQVEPGISVMQAAKNAGFEVPSMCIYNVEFGNHPSCMVCVVKNNETGAMFPSCAHKVTEGMNISTNTEEVLEAQKQALELLLSDHVGDCVAPCQPTCPAGMNIPEMNRLTAEGKHTEALQTVRKHIALPYVLGYICPAPCEKACRRAQIDQAVSICQIKKHTAIESLRTNQFFISKNITKSEKVAIIGSGPAGLSAAFYLLQAGYECVFFDKNEKPGGALRYEKLNHVLPEKVLDIEIEVIERMGGIFKNKVSIDKIYFENEILNKFDAVILAVGDFDKSNFSQFGFKTSKVGISVNKETLQTENLKVFACGSAVRSERMAVRTVGQGRTVALSVIAFLNKQEFIAEDSYIASRFGKLLPEEFPEYLKESVEYERFESVEGKTYEFTQKEAETEAMRCLHCDCRSAETCKLKQYSEQFRADRKRFAYGERKNVKKDFTHANIVFEEQKCIKCNLCVEISARNGEKYGFAPKGRGFDLVIAPLYSTDVETRRGVSLSDVSQCGMLQKTATECVHACPTNALAFR